MPDSESAPYSQDGLTRGCYWTQSLYVYNCLTQEGIAAKRTGPITIPETEVVTCLTVSTAADVA